ncbi:cytochrome P450 [Micromonospora lutea]|uniref:Cytochrome P450 n=1 Tax=Micromonospora lutea TaxID=419825 RepID=A0ABQ4IY88_9ACTN|nr:cytochrome P450 [Micromonospora lutea]GIJ22885.1 cytochrome P450 [Micromonospora lutea]
MRMAEPASTPPPTLDTIDLYDPQRYVDSSQHGAWRLLRDQAPMWAQQTPDGSTFWSVTRYDDVTAVLLDDENYGSEHGTILAVTGGDPAGGRTINLMDRPRHTRVRQPTIPLMSMHAARRHAPRVRDRIRRIVRDRLAGGGVTDWTELTLALPMAAAGDIIGIPESAWSDVSRWAMAGVAPDDPAYATGSASATLHRAHLELFTVLNEVIRDRRRRPQDDVVSELLRLDVGGRRLDQQEVLLNCYSFVMGAVTTTPQVAAHLVLALAERPEAWHTVRARPDLVPRAVEEALRWASPTNHLLRRTLAPVRLGEVDLGPGELVAAWIGAANRDERIFTDPYRFDPARAVNPHLAFGVGVHRCIGAPPAQSVLRILLEEMIGQLDGFEVAGPVVHLRSNFINGVTQLPISCRPVPARQAGVLV